MRLKKRNKKILLSLLCVFSIPTIVCGQENTIQIDSTNYKTYIRSLPAFTMYGDNYFITGTSTEADAFSAEGSDGKFEIGFKQRLTNHNILWDMIPYFTYRQKAFWDIYKESFPFRETNYNPSFKMTKYFVDEEGVDAELWFGFEHESNGRDEENSRSWNFFSVEYFRFFNSQTAFRAKAWLPVGDISDNDDILSYRGIFSLGITYSPSQRWYFDIDAQPAWGKQLQGNIKAGISFKVSKRSNQFLYLQYFGGYSEDLIDYDKSVSNIRLGIAFKDLFLNFKQRNN